jgi:hypothetical protein
VHRDHVIGPLASITHAVTIEAVECVSYWLTGGLIRSILSSTASTDGESTIESIVLDSIEGEDDDNSDSY